MYFLIAGIALMVMKYMEVGAIAGWSWYAVLSPFVMAVVWWFWADKSGYTKRKEIEKMDKRREDRIDKQRDAMGMLPRTKKKRK